MFDKIVYEQYEEVRKSGLCNMNNKYCVHCIAGKLELSDLITVINSGRYVEFLKTYDEAKMKGWI